MTTTAVDALSIGKTTHQSPPAVGPPAGLEHLLVGALLWTVPAAAAEVIALVADDDLADPHLALVLSALRDMTDTGAHISPQLVMDRLTREGVHRPVLMALSDATLSGAASGAAREYAAAVVAAALRRRTESSGVALSAAADEAPEASLADIACKIAARIADNARRLRALRGAE